jgi:hypothetical protein
MIKSKAWVVILLLACLGLINCKGDRKNDQFDEFSRTVKVDHWQYTLSVENQNTKKGVAAQGLNKEYLKATMYLGNVKTKQSLLYSASKDVEDYEAKYKYLSFNSGEDLYIKYKDSLIYPIGYVFEPSNGLSKSERLVYKFQISKDLYQRMLKENSAVEYWYIDRLVGLGKICFTQQ